VWGFTVGVLMLSAVVVCALCLNAQSKSSTGAANLCLALVLCLLLILHAKFAFDIAKQLLEQAHLQAALPLLTRCRIRASSMLTLSSGTGKLPHLSSMLPESDD
jgi:hypothetical protein